MASGAYVQGKLTYDFQSTIEKIRAGQETNPPVAYDIFGDKDQLSLVISEISNKGVIPIGYQLDFFNFAIFWYFTATFTIQAFALLYYRKFREN